MHTHTYNQKQVYADMADTLRKAAAARASHEYLGREFALGCFYRVAMFGLGIESRVRGFSFCTTHTYTHRDTHICTHTRAHAHHTYIYTRTHTHTHTDTHTHPDTHIYTRTGAHRERMCVCLGDGLHVCGLVNR